MYVTELVQTQNNCYEKVTPIISSILHVLSI